MAEKPHEFPHLEDKGVKALRQAIEMYKAVAHDPSLVGQASRGVGQVAREFSRHDGIQDQIDDLYNTHIKSKLKRSLGAKLGHWTDHGILSQEHFDTTVGSTVTKDDKAIKVKDALTATLNNSIADYVLHTLDPENKKHVELLERFRKDPTDYTNLLLVAKMADQLHGAQNADESFYQIAQELKDGKLDGESIKGVYQRLEKTFLTAKQNMPQNIQLQFSQRNEALYNILDPKQDEGVQSMAKTLGRQSTNKANLQGVGTASQLVMEADSITDKQQQEYKRIDTGLTSQGYSPITKKS